MSTLPVRELLDAWERGQDCPPPMRALLLLGAAWPQASAEELTDLSIGQRDACLLSVREQGFGSRLVAVATCTNCGDELELSFDVVDVRTPQPAGIDGAAGRGLPAPLGPAEVDSGGYHVRFRVPTSRDLLAVHRLSGPSMTIAAIRQALIELCVVEARRGDRTLAPSALPAAVVDAVEERMAEMDPQADVELAATCPACARTCEVLFDAAAFLWAEVNAWAVRTLHDVHRIASAYGWREPDILRLSPWRRSFYLEAIGG